MMSVLISKVGFLEKQTGKALKQYQRRYFIVRGAMLYWFKNRRDTLHEGLIFLRTCMVARQPSGDTNPGAFGIHAFNLAPFVLRAKNATEKLEWIEALMSAGAQDRSSKRSSEGNSSSLPTSPSSTALASVAAPATPTNSSINNSTNNSTVPHTGGGGSNPPSASPASTPAPPSASTPIVPPLSSAPSSSPPKRLSAGEGAIAPLSTINNVPQENETPSATSLRLSKRIRSISENRAAAPAPEGIVLPVSASPSPESSLHAQQPRSYTTAPGASTVFRLASVNRASSLTSNAEGALREASARAGAGALDSSTAAEALVSPRMGDHRSTLRQPVMPSSLEATLEPDDEQSDPSSPERSPVLTRFAEPLLPDEALAPALVRDVDATKSFMADNSTQPSTMIGGGLSVSRSASPWSFTESAARSSSTSQTPVVVVPAVAAMAAAVSFQQVGGVTPAPPVTPAAMAASNPQLSAYLQAVFSLPMGRSATFSANSSSSSMQSSTNDET